MTGNIHPKTRLDTVTRNITYRVLRYWYPETKPQTEKDQRSFVHIRFNFTGLKRTGTNFYSASDAEPFQTSGLAECLN
jgi:hypothetical protein